jgi:hypothetical protein
MRISSQTSRKGVAESFLSYQLTSAPEQAWQILGLIRIKNGVEIFSVSLISDVRLAGSHYRITYPQPRRGPATASYRPSVLSRLQRPQVFPMCSKNSTVHLYHRPTQSMKSLKGMSISHRCFRQGQVDILPRLYSYCRVMRFLLSAVSFALRFPVCILLSVAFCCSSSVRLGLKLDHAHFEQLLVTP